MQVLKITVVLFLLGSWAGCGKPEDKAVEAAPVSLHGIWQGFHTNLRTSAMEEPLRINMTFGGDGQFEAKNTVSSEKARGDYVDFFQSKKLVLDVTDSDFPAFGLRGLQEFKYEAQASELLLTSDFAMLKLKRENQPPAKKGADANWICHDPKGHNWSINIDGNDFWASITKEKSASILMKGSVRYEETTDEHLTGEMLVAEAQPAVDIGTLRWEKTDTDGKPELSFVAYNKTGQALKDLGVIDCVEK